VRRLRARRHRPEPWTPDIEEDGYSGPARLSVTTGARGVLDVAVTLAGHLEPLDGQYHWYGRVQQDEALDRAKKKGATQVVVTIGDGHPAIGRLAEHDAWGNLRVTGTGQPPFTLEPVEVDVPRTDPYRE
jgi:hypothetical protein